MSNTLLATYRAQYNPYNDESRLEFQRWHAQKERENTGICSAVMFRTLSNVDNSIG